MSTFDIKCRDALNFSIQGNFTFYFLQKPPKIDDKDIQRVAAAVLCNHPTAHSPLGPEEIRHLASVRRRTTPLQDLLRPRKPRSQGSKAALQLHPSPS